MKKFILRSAILFLMGICLIFVSYLFFKKQILSKDIYVKINQYNEFGKAEILIGGDSRGESGIDPDFFHRRTFNISTPGAGITTFVKALKVVDQRPDTILFTTGLSSLNDGRLLSAHFALMDDFFQIPFLTLNFKVKSLFFYFWNRFFSCQFNFDCKEEVDRMNQVKKNGFYPYTKVIKNDEKNIEIYRRYFLPFHRDLKTDGELWKVFQYQLNYLSNHFKNVLIIFPPFPNFFSNYIDRDGYKIFHHQIASECKKYKNVFFYDFNEIKGFQYSDDLFSDMVHLNESGAKRFTVDMINYINSSLQTDLL